MTETNKVEYRVKKVTLMNKMCPCCLGTGKRDQKIQGVFKSIPCIHCTNGVARIEHQTDISLKEALNEMGIYKMIENTVREIVNRSPTQTLPEGEDLKKGSNNINTD